MRLIDIVNSPWAITPEMFEEVQGIYARHMRGDKIDADAIEARIGGPLNNSRQDIVIEDGVALISIEGVLAKRMNLFQRISGGTSMQVAANQFRSALDDEAVNSIVLYIDSPGGTVDGTQELANLIFESRGLKPITAVADGSMQSAAYWIGSAADQVFIASDTTMVGSIGVVATHIDKSRLEKNAGIDKIEITAGRFKRLETESGSITREGRAQLQAQVDQVYALFVEAVAAHRGVTPEEAHERMADGRQFIGRNAIEAGLVDGVSTLSKAMTMAASVASTPMAAVDGEFDDGPETGANMNVEQLKKDHPDVAQALIDEGVSQGKEAGIAEGEKSGRAAGKVEGLIEGAEKERQRIKDVEAQAVTGHDDLIAEMKFDGETTGPEAAVRVLNAVREKGSARLGDLAADAAAASTAAAAAPEGEASADDPVVLANKARAYQHEQKQQGRQVSTAEAVAHVMSKKEAA